MNQSARDIILSRLDKAEKQMQTDISEQSIDADAQALLKNSPHGLLSSDNPVDAFIKRIEQGKVIGTTYQKIDSIEALPAAVVNFMAKKSLSMEVGIQKHSLFTTLDWKNLTDTGPQLDGLKDGLTALTYADFGIAETGSIVFHSGQDKPVLLNFLSLQQMIVIKEENILPLLDDYTQQLDVTKTPRNTIFITGASGTTDIEGVLVQGAHGPCEVHIFIIKQVN